MDFVLYADGGSRGNPGPAAYGTVIYRADGTKVVEIAEFLGTATNNVAEYNGLVAGLKYLAEFHPDAKVEVRMDSKLVVEQMSGRWKIKHPDMRDLALIANKLFPAQQLRFVWIPRAENSAADAMANRALDLAAAGITEKIIETYI
ncbi:MAG: hypothetical protein RL038_636 [Actinomycetota bacterium]|jgi:probable phosphoglycerate mutase